MICALLRVQRRAALTSWFHALSAGNIGHPPSVGPGGLTRSAWMSAVAGPSTLGIAAAAMPAPVTMAAAADGRQRSTHQPPIWLIERPGRMKLTWLIR